MRLGRTTSNFLRRIGGAVLLSLAALAGPAAAGVVPGLTGIYYDNINFTGSTVTRVDPSVDFNWGSGSPDASIGPDTFSVRWAGFVRAPVNGNYFFQTRSDDGVRLWVNGILVINNWTDHGPTDNTSAAVALTAGTDYAVIMEYYENGGGAEARLRWQRPGDAAFAAIPPNDGSQGLLTTDNTAPTVIAVNTSCGINNRVAVTFSEPVAPASATNTANYSIDAGAVPVTGAVLSPDQRTVILTTGVLVAGGHTVSVSGIVDLAAPPNLMAPGSAPFTYTGGGLRNGLTATYYDQSNVSGAFFTGSTVTQIDGPVDFNWGSGAPAGGIGADNFSVRWTGYVQAPSTGSYSFRTVSDDGVRLTVGGALIINNWTDHGPATDTSAVVSLVAGQYYPITLEYYERGGGAVVSLQWQPPAAAFTAIPLANLYHCDSTAPTLSGISTTCSVFNRVNVTFSEPVSPASAILAINYALNNGATVSGAAMTGDPRTVQLTTSPLSTGLTYTLTVNNVADTAIPPNTIAANSQINFTLSSGTLTNGIQGTYYGQGGVSGAFFTGASVVRVDPVVDFNWGGGNPAVGIGADNFSVRWTGYVQATVSGTYTFRTQSDDGIRLWVGGAPVINNWTDHGPTYNTGTVTLSAGQYYPVTLEYYERGGGAVAQFQWQKPGDATFSTVPNVSLFYCDTTTVVPGGFNAFETATAAGSITGVVKTKVAAQAFDLAVVALNAAKTGVETGFTGDVRIELLDASNNSGVMDTNGCRPTWAPLPVFVPPTLTFAAADLGRKNIMLTENNVWRDVRVRMTYPAIGAPAAVGCSTDNLAIRPAALSMGATDLDWQTAGIARALNNSAFPGGTVHKAGQPFTLTATGYNALSAVTTNYNGSPAANVVGFVLPVLGACPTCILNAGAFAGAGGTVVSNTASYSEVGAFQLQMSDDTFAAVDAGDGSSVAERTAYSTISTVGRFVPDHFTLTSGAVTAACSGFTYMNQPFQSLAATVQAQNAAGAVTVNYHSPGFPASLATVAWQAENADSGIDLSARLNVAAPSPLWNSGVYSVSTAAASFLRATPDNPDGPFDSLQLGVRLTDPDGVTLVGLDMDAGNVGCGPCNAKAVGGTTSVRFGRLRVLNAHGSELRALPLTVRSEYWNGTGFALNTADACTTILPSNIAFSNWQGGLVACETGLSGGGALVGGKLDTNLPSHPTPLMLGQPGVGNQGSVGLTIRLGPSAPGDASCTDALPVGPPYAAAGVVSAGVAWLQGNWDGTDQPLPPPGDGTLYDDDPVARATFGIYRDRLIYRREVP